MSEDDNQDTVFGDPGKGLVHIREYERPLSGICEVSAGFEPIPSPNGVWRWFQGDKDDEDSGGFSCK